MIINPHDFGSDLVEALGLKGRHITRITLDVQAKRFPQVRITEEVRTEDGESFKSVISRHELVPKVQT